MDLYYFHYFQRGCHIHTPTNIGSVKPLVSPLGHLVLIQPLLGHCIVSVGYQVDVR